MAYFKNPRAYEETKNAYQKILKSFPDSYEAHNWIARTAYHAEDYDTASRELEIIGDNWLPGCWENFKMFQDLKRNVEHLRNKESRVN